MEMLNCRSWSYHCRVIFSCISKAIFAAVGYAVLLFVFTLSLCLTPGAAQAQMAQLSEENLKGITGQAGVSINMDGGAQVYYNIIGFSDTEATPNWIELHNVKVDNGAGGNFLFSTRYDGEPVALVTNFLAYYTSGPKSAYTWAVNGFDILNDPKVQDGTIAGLEDGLKRILYPIFYDIATESGRTFVSIWDTSHLNPRYYTVGSFVLNAYSTNVTNSVYLSNTVGYYLAANSLTNPQLVSILGLNTLFNYSDPTTWTSSDVTLLAATGDPSLATLVSAYLATPTALHLQNQALGSIKLDALRQGPSLYRVWAHASQGVSFDYQTAISAVAFDAVSGNPIGGLHYHYNTTTDGVLSFANIHIAGLATGTETTPSTWAFSDTFKIGTIDGSFSATPATIDVATDTSNNTSLHLSLPMSGTVRVEEVKFGVDILGAVNNFGPIAIDGIQIHRLDLKISP